MMKRKSAWILCLCMTAFTLQGCAGSAGAAAPTQTPPGAKVQSGNVTWPRDKLETGSDGTPLLDVYVVNQEKAEQVDIETYVQGVLAGEMKNDWPMEALKAQAILARTFVLKFVEEKQSKYPNADISTDIEEAQAYDAEAVNSRIKQAVAETRGLVLVSNGRLPYAWFHAHSGGVTEQAAAGLNWKLAEPIYTQVTDGKEPETAEGEKDRQALQDAQSWQTAFSLEEFAAACAKQGVETDLSGGASIAISRRGESGRAVILSVGGQEVNASELRIALGSTKMRSTLLTSLKTEGGKVMMAGKGYGHGVGMSQWGAYGMANEGSSAREIVEHYFRDITVEKLWQ